MAKSILVTADTDLVVPVGNARLVGVMLCAGTGATGIAEIFDGTVASGNSIAKLSAVANESAPPLVCSIDTTAGISVDITGSGAKAYLIYE